MAKVARDATRAADRVEKGFAAANSRAASSFARVGTGAQRGFTQMQQGARQSQQAVQQLTFQLNDISTSLSGGASPFQVMMQQGSQVAQVMGGIRAAGGSIGQTVAGAFASMLNPISLVSFGLIALAGYALQYGLNMGKAGQKSEEMLKAEQQLIDGVIKKWGELLPTLTEIEAARERVAEQGQVREATEIRAKEQYTGLIDALDAIAVQFEEVIGLMQAAGEIDAAAKLSGDWAGLEKKIEDGTATVDDLKAAVKSLSEYYDATGSPAVKTLIDSLNGQISAMDKASTTANKLRNDMAKATPEQLKFNEALKDMRKVAEAQLSDVEKLIGKYKEAIAAASTLEDRQQAVMEGRALGEFVAGRERIATGERGKAKELIQQEEGFIPFAKWDVNAFRTGFGSDTITDALGRVQKVTQDTVTTVADAERDLDRRLGEFQATIQRQIGTEFWKSFDDDQKAALSSVAYNYGSLPDSIVKAIKAGASRSDVAKAIAGLSSNPERRKREAEIFGGAGFSATPKEDRSAKDKTQYTDWKKDQQEKIALLEREKIVRADMSLTVNQQDAAIEAAKLYQDGLNQAKAQGLTITAALTAEIRKQADASAEASLAIADLATARTADTQQAKEQKAAAEALNQQYQAIAKTAMKGFINDLRNGVSAGEAFTNVLDRIVDGIIDMTLEAMFAKQAVGGATASGGGLFGFIGKILGFGMHQGGTVGRDASFVRPVGRHAFVGAKRYQRGGVAGFAPGEVPIIAHKGEVIIPKGAVGRAARGGDVTNHNNQRVQINVDNQGNTLVKEGQGTAFGQLLNKAVEQVILGQQRPGGMLQDTRPGRR